MVMALVFLIVLLLGGGLLCGILLLLSLQNLRKKASDLEESLQKQKTQSDGTIKQWADYATSLDSENKRLAKWKDVADADAKASELLRTATESLDKANTEATQLKSDAEKEASSVMLAARTEADSVSATAKQQAKQMKDEASGNLSAATIKASQIVEAANKRAEEIAGSAYDAMKNVALFERTAKAMKDIIEGYGDQYLIPSHSLLDDLADDFGHLQAGQELKRAREQTKLMIRNGTAAKCEYVEANRRDTAINFVTDAFNGKVDSVLSRVRHDNAGTLEQEIRDAFVLVNFNGKAFREARVTDEYLAARLEELKWAAIAQELKLEEREEQRRIKEQMREEEKARREYERAMRDAAKEEEYLHKAMEKAQQQIEQASAEQKAMYEEKLQQLAQQLKEAEERSQRAISMAQQTRRGHVYIISNVGSFGDNIYKIGLTRRLEPLDRVRELGDSSVPFEFDVHAMLFSEDAPALESKLHKHFILLQMNKVNHRKEFFRVDLAHVREEVEKLGLAAKWTMAAEAREYHETTAIEQAIGSDPMKRDAWVRRQFSLELGTDDTPEDLEVATEQ